MRTKFATAAIICAFGYAPLLAVQAAYASSDMFSSQISGVWVGSGSIYKSHGAPREPVRCRFSSKTASHAGAIAVRYICLGIDVKFETTGTLKFNKTKQTIAGKLVTVGVGAFAANGKHQGNNLALRLTGKDKKTGKPLSATLSISLKGKSKFASSLTATDPKTGKRFQAFKASFKR